VELDSVGKGGRYGDRQLIAIQLPPNLIQSGIEMNPTRVLPIAICELNRLSAA
jgi:hypothetical protein